MSEDIKYDKGVELVPKSVILRDFASNSMLIENKSALEFDFSKLIIVSKIIGAIQYFSITGSRYSFAYRSPTTLFLFKTKEEMTAGVRIIVNGDRIEKSRVSYLAVNNVTQF